MILRRTTGFLIVILLALSAIQFHPVSAERTAVGSFTLDFTPIADTYVNMSNPARNYGALKSIEVNSQTLAYIMFDLSGLPANATIAGAILKLYCYAGTYMIVGSGYISAHYCSDNSWTENSITWENKPSYESEFTDTETHGMYVGWDYWDVTKDAQTTVMKEDKRLTIVLRNYNIRGSYDSREKGPSRVVLTVEYLSPPAYVVMLESKQDTGETSNIGIVMVADEACQLPTELLAKPGNYPLEYEGEYEFVRWDTAGSIRVSDRFSEKTTIIVEGAGRLTAIGKVAKLVLEAVQDTGVTSNIGYIVLDDIPYMLPTEASIIKPGTHTLSYEGGYKFIKWEAIGDVSISDPSKSTTTATISAGSCTIRAVGSVETMEYAYDDGSMESYNYKDEDVGEMWAVRFTPIFSGRLLKARFYISGNPAGFKIHLMDENRNPIIDSFTRTPYSTGWFDVDLSEFNVQVRARKDFYIGVEWITRYKPEIGYDYDFDFRDERSWYWDGTSWRDYPDYSDDVMIRAVVETIMLGSSITCFLASPSIPYSGITKISGSISPSDSETAGATVKLQYSPDGFLWSDITIISCVSSSYSYFWSPTLPVGEYLVRAIWEGSDNYFGAGSSTQSLTITKVQTTLTCRFDAETAATDQFVGISGSISPRVGNAEIVLMFTSPDGYEFNQSTWTSPTGDFTSGIKVSKEGVWKVKACWLGDENHFGSESETSQIKVETSYAYYIAGLLVVLIVIGLFSFLILRRRKERQRKPPPAHPLTRYPPPPPPPPPKPHEEYLPKPPERKTSYVEKDNMGTRQDTLDLANAYWIARISSPKKDPFVVYTFDKENDARNALLELDCIHVAENTGKLICTKVLVYGYYPTEDGRYEAIVCGDELTHELWEKAKASFIKHGGRRKNDQEPEIGATPTPEARMPEIGKIVFIREDRKLIHGQMMIYRIYKGPDAISAKAFLQQNPVTRQFYYIIVETPEGNYGRDIQGIYKE